MGFPSITSCPSSYLCLHAYFLIATSSQGSSIAVRHSKQVILDFKIDLTWLEWHGRRVSSLLSRLAMRSTFCVLRTNASGPWLSATGAQPSQHKHPLLLVTFCHHPLTLCPLTTATVPHPELVFPAEPVDPVDPVCTD